MLDEPGVASNKSRLWSAQGRPPFTILKELVELCNHIIRLNSDQNEIELNKLVKCKKCQKFLDDVAEIQTIDLDKVPENQQLPFFLDLLQIMQFHHKLYQKLSQASQAQ